MTQWRCHALVEKNYMRNRCAYFYIYRRTAYPRRGTSMAGHRFCILVGGITLAHIAIVQQLPKYNFWITLTAAGLAYALYSTHNETLGQEKEIIDARLEYELEKAEAYQNRKKHPEKNRKRKEKPGLTLRLILK